jgi:hypothetical protein
MSWKDRTAAERNAALRERERAAGLMRATVVIPAARKAELDALVASWREAAAVGEVAEA